MWITAVYDTKDSVSMCKHWKAPVNTGKMKNAGRYTQIMALVCLIFSGVFTNKYLLIILESFRFT